MKVAVFRILVVLFGIQHRITSSRYVIGLSAVVRRAYWKPRLQRLGEKSSILRHVVIRMPHLVSIGSRCTIAEFVHIWGGGGVTIGDDVLIASHVAISSMTHDKSAEVYAKTSVRIPIVIEDNVWIGAGAIILPGVRLGEGCIVGAGAVVTRSVPPKGIVVGVPAQQIDQRDPSLK